MFYLLLPALTLLQGAFEIVQNLTRQISGDSILSSLRNKMLSLDQKKKNKGQGIESAARDFHTPSSKIYSGQKYSPKHMDIPFSIFVQNQGLVQFY